MGLRRVQRLDQFRFRQLLTWAEIYIVLMASLSGDQAAAGPCQAGHQQAGQRGGDGEPEP